MSSGFFYAAMAANHPGPAGRQEGALATSDEQVRPGDERRRRLALEEIYRAERCGCWSALGLRRG